MLNEATLIGHLGRDPEIKTTKDGNKVANLSIATSEHWTDKRTGERMQNTEWHRAVVWNEHLVELAEKYLKSGAKVFVRGKLVTRKWQDGDGEDRYTTEIVLGSFNATLRMLDGKKDADQPAGAP